MPPPFWVHCNICNSMISTENTHYLLSCSHLLCKSCMKKTDGKKCPLDKREIRFEEIMKLPDNVKVNFQPNLKNLVAEPAKILNFQQDQIANMTKLTREYKNKAQMAMKVCQKEKEELMKAEAELETLRKERRLMQQKLKEMYMQNKQKNKNQVYRNPATFTPSTPSSSGRKLTQSPSSFVATSSGFFDEQSIGGTTTSYSGFFRSSGNSSSSSSRRKSLEHTQSDRSPFFA